MSSEIEVLRNQIESLKRRKLNPELKKSSRLIEKPIYNSEQNSLLAKERNDRYEESGIIKTLLDDNIILRGENNTLKLESTQKYNLLLTVTTELEHRLVASQKEVYDNIETAKKYKQLFTVAAELEQKLVATQKELHESLQKDKKPQLGRFMKCTIYDQFETKNVSDMRKKFENVIGFIARFESYYGKQQVLNSSYGFSVLVWKDLEKHQYKKLVNKGYEFRILSPNEFMFHSTPSPSKDINKFIFVIANRYDKGEDNYNKILVGKMKNKKLCDLFIDSLNY
jgi:hypothetical protein